MSDQLDLRGFLLPEGAIPLSTIRLARFLDDRGEERIWWKVDGDSSVAQTLGMLAMASHDYAQEMDVEGG